MTLKNWKKSYKYRKTVKYVWRKGNKTVEIHQLYKGANYTLYLPYKGIIYYPKLKDALRDAKKYMRKH